MQEQSEVNAWTQAWSSASLDQKFELIATYYQPALYRTAHRAFTEANKGAFSNATLMNYGWAQDAVQDAMTNQGFTPLPLLAHREVE